MNIAEIEKEAKKFLENAKGCHDWSHVERVYNLCLKIGKKENADMDIVRVAALLHDIGREEEVKSGGKICHAQKSAELAEEILKKHKVDSDKISKIIHCIASHRFRGNKVPESKEAKVLFDADKIDSIGATGIGRAFLWAGEVGAALHNKKVNMNISGEYSKEDTAFREFSVKLSKVKDRLFTKEGKRIAEERHEFMVIFFDRLNKETDGLL